MYVCICNSVTDRDIKYAVHQGHDTFEQVQNHLRVATCCGRCQSHAREVIQEALSEQRLETTASPLSGLFCPA